MKGGAIERENNVNIGRKGEIFVMQKLLSIGWKFPPEYYKSFSGTDWVFEKGDRTIRIQVKTSCNKIPRFSFSNQNFDYLLLTNLSEIFVLPREVIFPTNNRLTKTFRLLANKFELLDFSDKKLLSELIDCRIGTGNLVNTAHIFFPQKV